MPLRSTKDVRNLKLSSLGSTNLRKFAAEVGQIGRDNCSKIIKRLVELSDIDIALDAFIKQQYMSKIAERRNLIGDEALVGELNKVQNFSWGAVQGQLDRKIQNEYVRRFVQYDELINNVRAKLHDEITSHVVCTWYNHWTTVLIEEHIGQHPKVVPTLKSVKGIDVFFDGQPFDLKTTYVPRGYDVMEALKSPRELAIWLYENQGAQRFGADNRLFVILVDRENPSESWKLKREFKVVFERIDQFFNNERVSEADEIPFTFGRKTYTAVCKILVITNK